jgi:hypothetical protein
MLMIRQNLGVPPLLDIEAAIDTEWDCLSPSLTISPAARVAVGVGSRGINNLSVVTRKVVDKLKQALAAALMTIRPSQPEEVGIVYIKNTLDLRRMMVSQAYAEQLERDPGVVAEAVRKKLEFDSEGMLKSPFES